MAPLTALASRFRGGEEGFIDPIADRKAPAVVSGDNVYIAWWTNNRENGNEEVMFRASNDGGQAIPWIEKLLQTPIEDHRKRARDLIIVPYLVVRKGMTDPQQISDTVMQWADKCGELRSLQPSRRDFEHKVRDRTHEVMHTRISQMKLATLKVKYPDLYEILKLGEGA
jgi:hypothetical protein